MSRAPKLDRWFSEISRRIRYGYLGLILFFRSKGGYKPVVLDLKQ